MKIEIEKSQEFKPELIECFESDSDWKDFQNIASKWANELCKDAIQDLIKAKKYMGKDTLTFSVSVAFDNGIKDQEIEP